MKIGILSDLHLHEHTDFAKMVAHNGIYINSRLKDILDTLWNCFQVGHKKGVTRWLILGDVFHTRGQVPTVVRNTTWDLLQRAHHDFNCDFQILVGNHDQADRDGKIHSIYEWQCGWIDIIDEPVEIDNVYFIPYMASHEDLIHCLTRIDIDPDLPKPVLCMHAGVDGAAVGTLEYRIKDPLTVEDLDAERFDWVFLGHYHKPQTLADNVVYVGSPCQLTRAEAGDTKRFLIYDTESGKVSSVRTRCKEFHLVSWPECREDSLDQGYYDVVVTDETDPETIRRFFGEKGITSVKLIVPAKADNGAVRLEVDETTTDDTLIQQYCTHRSAPKGADEVGLALLAATKGAVASNLRIRFLDVEAANFLSLGKCQLSLAQTGSVIAVLGENHDAEGFESNGSGKSSLLPESIFWCLFGETARGVPADDVVNNIKKRNCYVTVSLKLDKQLIQVTRARKHKELGSSLYVTVNGKDMTQGTNAATQTYLEQMLGMDYTTFSSVVAFSPETLRFVNSKDSEQKAVLDSILQTQRFGEAQKLAKERLKVATTHAATLSSQQALNKNTLTQHQGALEVYVADLKQENQIKKSWEAEEKAACKQLRETQKKLKEEIKVLQFKLDQFEVPTLVDESLLTEAYSQASALLSGATATLQSAEKSAKKIQDDLNHILDQEGKPCPTCGQVVQNLSKMKANLSTQRRTVLEEIETFKGRVAMGTTAKAEAHQRLTDAQRHNARVRELQNTQKDMQRGVSQTQAQLDSVEQCLNNRAAYDDRRIHTLEFRIQNLEKDINNLQNVIDDNAVTLLENQQVVSLLQFWVDGFGNKGLKSFLLDSVIPHLTQHAQTFADRLTGNSVQIKFSTVSDTGIDRFRVSAINNAGSDVYSGNSSGEKRRIDLAVMFALFLLANSRVKLNLMLLDEVMDTLDAAGIDTVVEILEEMARDRKLTIFVTSHTELADRLHESITIQKRGGLSSILIPS